MHTAVNPDGLPINPVYSQGLLTRSGGRTLYISGQVGIGPDGRTAGGIAEQTRAAIGNLNAVLAGAGMSPEHLAKVTIYLTDPADLAGFMEAGGGNLPVPPPATTLLIVKALAGPELRVEIEAVAVD